MCKENEKETVVEINKAIIAGKRALSALKEARQSLKCASDWAVSYTHLDVYKRQIIARASSLAFI